MKVGVRELRAEIEKVDEELLGLLNRRARIAAELGCLNSGGICATSRQPMPGRTAGSRGLPGDFNPRVVVPRPSTHLEELSDLL